jgi:NAD(P)H-flavin reductase
MRSPLDADWANGRSSLNRRIDATNRRTSRRHSTSTVVLVSDDVIYSEELRAYAEWDPKLSVLITVTRDLERCWRGAVGRISPVQRVLTFLGGVVVDSFVCGPSDFVERSSELLVQAGQPSHAVRTERLGHCQATGE